MNVKDEALQLAMETFESYAKLHRVKNTEEGLDKARRNDEMARIMRTALDYEEEGHLNDRKFKILDGRLVNRVSGVAIPDHEPVFIFRSRDRHLPAVLAFYQTIVADSHHRQAIGESIEAIRQFSIDYAHEMKEPGVTHDFKLTVPAPKNSWEAAWEKFGKPTVDRIHRSDSQMTAIADWSDGEETTIDFRSFSRPVGITANDLRLLFHERRFAASED